MIRAKPADDIRTRGNYGMKAQASLLNLEKKDDEIYRQGFMQVIMQGAGRQKEYERVFRPLDILRNVLFSCIIFFDRS